MIKHCVFSYNFAYTIMKRYTVLKESKQSFHLTKNPLVINFKGKLKKPLDFLLRCQTRCIWFAHLLVEIPRGFELQRNWSLNCDNRSQQHVAAIYESFGFIGPTCTS